MAAEKPKENGEGARIVSVYHERQRLQLCLLHALNNLVQGENAFTRRELDGIADNLPSVAACKNRWSPLSMIFKRHHNTLTGDYDVNVLIAALGTRGKEVIWYDRRKGADGLDLTAYGSRFCGILVNIITRRFGRLWKNRHWVTLRPVNGMWYNLDSDMAGPLLLHKGEEDLKRYLEVVFSEAGEVLIVIDEDGLKSSSVDSGPATDRYGAKIILATTVQPLAILSKKC